MKEMRRTGCIGFVLAMAVLLPSLAEAKLELPRIFGNDMVVQRDKPLSVWGWGDKGNTVTVQFNGQTKTAVAGDDGQVSDVVDVGM